MSQERRRRRALSPEDRALWESVTRSVVPLRARPAVAATAPDEAQSKALPPPAVLPAAAAPGPAQHVKTKPPPLVELGRRGRQRVARGNMEIEARLDLHGMTQERAHAALARFLRVAQANDARLVLVITGKGRSGDERGVLRRMVPQWLSLPEARSYVVGYEPAHVAHGGEGALYVRLRRAR